MFVSVRFVFIVYLLLKKEYELYGDWSWPLVLPSYGFPIGFVRTLL